MALWTKAQQLPAATLQQIQTIYGDHFPIEIRHFLAYWIDVQNWTNINPDYQAHEPMIKELMSRFIREIEEKANSFNGADLFVTKLKFTDTANLFKQRYESNPVGLYRSIRNCLLNEMNLIQQTENMLNPQMNAAASYYGNPSFLMINQEIERLKEETTKIANIIEKFRSEQEAFSLKYYKFQEISERLSVHQQSDELQLQQMAVNGQSAQDPRMVARKLTESKRQLEFELQDKVKSLEVLQHSIIKQLQEKSISISNIINRVLDKELINWKRRQQLAGNGAEFDTSHLDILQTWCEGLAEIIWINLTKVKEATRIARVVSVVTQDAQIVVNNLFDLNKKFTEHLTTIVLNTFILEKQPPQVMKTNTRFSAKIRFLVGSKLNIHMSPPQVKVSIISEAQANLLLTEKIIRGDVSGEILNNAGAMEYDQTSKQLSITFRNMQLKKIKRAEKKGSESVVDEKFSLFFSSKFTIAGDLEFGVWTMSLPVTVIVHGNQEPHAWATITWDNAFAETGRKPFVVPDKVPWGKVAIALNVKFTAVTGRPLSPENMKYLSEKLFRAQCASDDYDTMQVSWTQFSKESLADRSFTFWDWFYAIMKLTKEHLKPLWTDGHIVGFLRKQDAENLLSNCSNGTFLLRFSDSELGGITIAWVGGTGDQKEVIMLQPFTAKDFAIRTLADRLNDLNHLLYLYPDIPKEKAFGRHYTPFNDSQCASSNGYVKPLLVTHVPGWGAPNPTNPSNSVIPNGIHSYPTTPHSILIPNSPTSTIGESVGSNYEFLGMDYTDTSELTQNMDFSSELKGFDF